jgi:hypothetical protein
MENANRDKTMNEGRGPLVHVSAIILYAALAVLFTYPLVFNMDRVNGSGDPAVMVWSMAWIQNAIISDASLYDANIFYPTANTLAYTDLLLPSAVATLPIYLLTGNPLINFNVILLLTYILSGYTVFLLAKRIMARMPHALPASLFAGAVYALCPYRMGHITQLNSMTTYLLPLILLFMHKYLEDGRKPRDLFFVALFFALNATSGFYYGIFATLMMATFFIVWSLIKREFPKKKDFIYGAVFFGLFGIVLAYVLWPYLALSGAEDHSRPVEQAAGGSVIPAALLTSPPESLLLGWTPEALGTSNEDGKPMYELTLYPGLAVAALAAFGLFFGRIRTHSKLYALLGLVIFVFSLGPLIPLGDINIPLPFYLLYEFVPGFGSLRVPARMWAIIMIPIAVLAAFGLRKLMEILGGNKATLAVIAVSIFTIFEFLPTLPVDRFIDRGPPTLEPAYEYLAENAGPQTVVAEVPFASPVDAFRETPRMVRSTYGWWSLVNGYASYFPEGYEETRDALNSVPSSESHAEMDRLGVDFIIVHPDLYEDEGEDGDAIVDAVESEESLRRVAGNEEAVLYRVE